MNTGLSNSWFARIRPHLGPILFLLMAAFIVYGRILGHDFISNWDDSYYVSDNEAVQGFSWANVRTVFSSCYTGNYAPVQMLSYMLDYTFWGLKAGGFLLSNIVIHAANSILFYYLLFRWYGDRLLALIAAALFLLHPVQVESVAWVSQRKNLLAMFFFLLAWEGYRRYRAAEAGKGRLVYAASITAFVLSLLSKSVAVIFPVVLVLYDLCFSGGDRRVRLKDKIPFVIAAGVVAVIAVYSQQPEDDGWMGRGGGITSFHGGSPLATFFTMLPVFCRYLGMLVWPADLSLLYAPHIHRYVDLQVAAAAILLASVGLAGFWLYRIDRRLGFWVIFFWVGLLPVSQIVPLATMMNDRYLYFPMLGGAALFGAGAVFLRERFGTYRRMLLYVFALPLILLMMLSFQRAAVWRNSMVLWRDVVAKNPTFAYGWHKLGEAYHFSAHPMKNNALQAYRRALEINPMHMITWYHIGILYNDLGEYEKGYEALQTFLEYNSDHVMGLAALGDNYLKRGKYPEAEKTYKRALALQPDALQVVGMLGNLALTQGQFDQARDYYRRVEAQWHDPESAFQLACVESLAGRKDGALNWLEKALQRGYNDYSKLYLSKELTAIRDEARFNFLLQKYVPERISTTNGESYQ